MQEFSGGEGPCSVLRYKSKVDLSSKGQKSFLCREEKEKAAWGHLAGPGNWWLPGSDWKLGFTAFLITRGWRFWHGQILKEKCLPGVNERFLGRRRGIFPPG
jgi:hypothetical protein